MPRKIADKDSPSNSRWRASGFDKSYSFILRVRVHTLAQSGNRRVHYVVEDVQARSTKRFSAFDPATAWLSSRVASSLTQSSGIPAGH